MAWAQLAAQGVGNTLNAIGTYKAGQEQALAYKYAAAQDDANARLQAMETAAAEDKDRKLMRANTASLAGRMAENGLAGGSFDRIYEESVRNMEQDVQNTRYRGMSLWANLKNSASMNRLYAKQAKKNARFSALMTLHGGAAQALGTASQYWGKGTSASDWTANDSKAFRAELGSLSGNGSAFKTTGGVNKLSLF